ncbi:MAG: hypothetical protein ACI3XS_04610 [Eubacteriales bacterium]
MKNKKIFIFFSFLMLFVLIFSTVSFATLPDRYQSRFFVDWTKFDVPTVATKGSTFYSDSSKKYKWYLDSNDSFFGSIAGVTEDCGATLYCNNSNYAAVYCSIGSFELSNYTYLSVVVDGQKYIKVYQPSDIGYDSSYLKVGTYQFTIKNRNDVFYLCWSSLPPGTSETPICESIEVISCDNSSLSSAINDVYKIGENDGLTTGETAKKTIFSFISAPFIALSNILSFDIFGINLFTIFKILLTIALIGFIISLFRKG